MAYKLGFADKVREALAGRPYRQVAAKIEGVNISPAYIADMVQGRVPRRELVVAFGWGCGLEREGVDELLAAAGLGPLSDDEEAPPDANALLSEVMDRAEELEYSPEFSDVTVQGFKGAQNLSASDLKLVDQTIRALLTETRKRQGRE